jgi:hypothetical protein
MKRQRTKTVEALIEQLKHLDSLIVDAGVPTSSGAVGGNVMTN